MKCLICNEMFYIKKSILDLFKEKKEYICNRCYKKYPINLKLERVQLDLYEAIVISIFDKKYRIPYDAYFLEYGKVFKTYFKKDGYTTLFFDSLDFSDETLGVLDCISKMNNSNLIVVTFYTKQ